MSNLNDNRVPHGSSLNQNERTSLSNNTKRTYDIPQDEETFHDVVIPENLVQVIITLWLGTFLSAADTTIVATTANSIASSMNGSEKLSWIATSYLITNTIFQPLVGRFSDVFGRRTVLMVAQFWFALGCLLCALSQNVTQFAIARAIAGIGGGGMSALSSIITTDIIPLRMRGIYQGYANLIYGLGQFTGPILGSAFLAWNEESGWRWMFLIQVPMVIVAGILVQMHVHEYRQDQMSEVDFKTRFAWQNFSKIDLPGSFLLSCAIISLLMLFNVDSRRSLILCVGCFFVSTISFYLVEKYVMTVNIIPPDAFQGILRITAFIIFFGSGAVYGMNYNTPLYLQIVHDFSQIQLGVYNAFGVFSTSIGSLIAGWYLKHEDSTVSHKVIVSRCIYVSLICCSLMMCGVFISMFTSATIAPTLRNEDLNTNTFIKIGIILFGFIISSIGYGSFLVALLILVVGLVGVKKQATVTGMNYMFRSMGQSCGVGLALGLYNHNLVGELREYFGKKDPVNGMIYVEKLTKSSYFIRNGLPTEYIRKVLKLYRLSISDAMILSFAMSLCAFVLSLALKIYQNKDKSITI